MNSSVPDAVHPTGMVRIWDPFVRIFHWSLVTSFTVAWFTARTSEDIHYWAGYAAGSLVFMRLLWGIFGTPHARFSQFVRGPAAILRYLTAILSGREARHLGHNPAGGAMVVTLMAAMLLAAVSGWMMTTDEYFGVDWVENLHSLTVHGLLFLIAVHVGGVILASFRHRENLVAAMFTGRKRLPGSSDIT